MFKKNNLIALIKNDMASIPKITGRLGKPCPSMYDVKTATKKGARKPVAVPMVCIRAFARVKSCFFTIMV